MGAPSGNIPEQRSSGLLNPVLKQNIQGVRKDTVYRGLHIGNLYRERGQYVESIMGQKIETRETGQLHRSLPHQSAERA